MLTAEWLSRLMSAAGVAEFDAVVTPAPNEDCLADSEFPSVASMHGGWQNRVILALVFVVFGGLLVCIVVTPFAFVFADDHWAVSYAESPSTAAAFLIVYFGVFACALAALLKYVVGRRNLDHDSLLVDSVGIHFLRSNRTIRKITYADLLASPDPALPDVSLESRRYSTGRGGHITRYYIGLLSRSADGKPEQHRLDFRGWRLGYSHFSNRYELIATFLKGVARYRPDLVIAPSVMFHYYIDPTTGCYDRKAHVATEIIVNGLLVLLVVAIIFMTW